METINLGNIKSCCNEMKSCFFPGEGSNSKEEAKTEINKVIENCKDAMEQKMGTDKKHVTNRIKWFMFLPSLILISAFLLTLLLNPELVQILWLLITGTLIALGFLSMLMIHRWFGKIKKQIKA